MRTRSVCSDEGSDKSGVLRRLARSGPVVTSALAVLLIVPAASAAEPEIPVGPEIPSESVDLGVKVSSLPHKKVPGPSKKGGTYTARILAGTAVRPKAGGKATRWYARTRTKWSGGPQRLMVLGSRTVGGKLWLNARLPIRPNGTSGWIRRDRVQIVRSRWFIELDRSRRMLTMFRAGRAASRFRVVVGAPSTPTPLGLFALYDRVRQPDPDGFIGPWAIPLTAHSNQLRRYDGGPGLVAFHGRDGASLRDPLGSARSHGCVRMINPRIAAMARMMTGTAVKIRR